MLETRASWRHSGEMQAACFIDDVQVLVPVRGVPQHVERLPDGKTTVVARSLEDGSGDVWILGPRTKALFKTATGVARAVTVDLQPGWTMAMLGVPASELVDRHVSLDDLWGREGVELRDELLAMHDAPAIVDRLAQVFASRLRRTGTSASSRLARQAIRLIEHDARRVEQVASDLGVSARHLRRVFAENIGIGPKELGRCVRLQRAVRRASTGDWGRIAADAGYYDQAHLIGDFRDLVGVTPSAYARRAVVSRRCDHARAS